jgi:hypothetical protein
MVNSCFEYELSVPYLGMQRQNQVNEQLHLQLQLLPYPSPYRLIGSLWKKLGDTPKRIEVLHILDADVPVLSTWGTRQGLCAYEGHIPRIPFGLRTCKTGTVGQSSRTLREFGSIVIIMIVFRPRPSVSIIEW